MHILTTFAALPSLTLQGLPIDAYSAEKMRLTAAELVDEKELAMECIKDA